MDDYTKLIGIKLAGGTPDLGLNHIIVKELAKDPLFANCLFDVDNADTWDDIFSTQLREVKKVWKIVKQYLANVELLRTCDDDNEKLVRLQERRSIDVGAVNRTRNELKEEWMAMMFANNEELERIDNRIAARRNDVEEAKAKLDEARASRKPASKRAAPAKGKAKATGTAINTRGNRGGGVARVVARTRSSRRGVPMQQQAGEGDTNHNHSGEGSGQNRGRAHNRTGSGPGSSS